MIPWRNWALTSAVIAVVIAGLMVAAWRVGVEAAWAGAYATSLAVSVALAAALLQHHRSAKSAQVEKGTELLRALTVYDDPFERLIADAVPDKLPEEPVTHIERIEAYKLAWERSSWGADIQAALFLGQSQQTPIDNVITTGKEMRAAMAGVVKAIRTESFEDYGAYRSDLIRLREKHETAVNEALNAIRTV